MLSRPALAFRAGATAARLLPTAVADAAGRALAGVAMKRGAERRGQVERNLRRVHGSDIEPDEFQQQVRRTFESYARYWVESFRLPGTSAADLEAGMSVEGFEHIEDALAAGKGAVVALPHLGGWEWAGFWLAVVKHIPLTVVVERLEPPDVFEWFVSLRESFGMTVVPLGPEVAGGVLGALRDNHVVVLLSDRGMGGSVVEVEFFGERTTLPAGPATIALRTGAPILPAAIYHRGKGHHGLIRPPLAIERRGKFREDVIRITQDLATELEVLIRAAPDQWHLMQPNWPSDPGYRSGKGGESDASTP